MVKLPEYDALHFCFDNDNGCSLTVLVNNERFHITIHPKQFQDRSKEGKEIQQTYRRLLQNAKAAEQNDELVEEAESSEDGKDEEAEDQDRTEDAEQERDSAVDVSSPEVEEEEIANNPNNPLKALHDWILTPLSQGLPSQSSKSDISLQDWYHTPLQFYTLSTSSGTLIAKETPSPTCSLHGHLKEILLPTITIPNKTLNLSIPQFNASEFTVLSCAADPAPYHPILVEHQGNEFFLKPVDSTQPGPTVREIHLLHEIVEKGLHLRKDFRCPELKGLVYFSSDSTSQSSIKKEKKKKKKKKNHIAALLLTPIPNPIPLTRLLDSSVPEEKRTEWAKDTERMVEILHENGIVWGDAKGDNFLVAGRGEGKVWIIDFGGSYTEGWVDEEVKETVEGDWMGTEKVVNALEDPEGVVEGVDGEEGGEVEEEEVEVQDAEEERKAHAEEEDEEADETTNVETKAEDTDNDEASNENLQPSPTKSSPLKRSHPTTTEPDEIQEPPSKQRKRSKNTPDNKPQDTKYCFCNGVSAGRMLACDGKECKREWFHFECLGIEEAPEGRKWFCEECS